MLVNLKRDWFDGASFYYMRNNPIELPDDYDVDLLPKGAVIVTDKNARPTTSDPKLAAATEHQVSQDNIAAKAAAGALAGTSTTPEVGSASTVGDVKTAAEVQKAAEAQNPGDNNPPRAAVKEQEKRNKEDEAANAPAPSTTTSSKK